MGGHGTRMRGGEFSHRFFLFIAWRTEGHVPCTYAYVRVVESGLRVAAITRGGGGQFLPHRASAIVTFRFH